MHVHLPCVSSLLHLCCPRCFVCVHRSSAMHVLAAPACGRMLAYCPQVCEASAAAPVARIRFWSAAALASYSVHVVLTVVLTTSQQQRWAGIWFSCFTIVGGSAIAGWQPCCSCCSLVTAASRDISQLLPHTISSFWNIQCSATHHGLVLAISPHPFACLGLPGTRVTKCSWHAGT